MVTMVAVMGRKAVTVMGKIHTDHEVSNANKTYMTNGFSHRNHLDESIFISG